MKGDDGDLDMEKVEQLREVTKWRNNNIRFPKVKEVVQYGENRNLDVVD